MAHSDQAPWYYFAHALADDPDGVRAVLDAVTELGLDPREVAWVIEAESYWNPAAHNPYSRTDASGLLQWTRQTLERMRGPTTAEIREYSRELQAPFVAQYLAPFVRDITRPGDVYIAVFRGALGESDSKVIGPPGGLVWTQNPSLRGPGNAAITIGDVRAAGIPAPDGEYAGPASIRVEREKPASKPSAKRAENPPSSRFPWLLLVLVFATREK